MLYFFDYSNLIEAVYNKGLSSKEVAEILGISERKYLLKLNNQEEFTQKEISLLVDNVLDLSPESIPDFFFRGASKEHLLNKRGCPLVTLRRLFVTLRVFLPKNE